MYAKVDARERKAEMLPLIRSSFPAVGVMS